MAEGYPVIDGFEFTTWLRDHDPTDPMLRYDHCDPDTGDLTMTAILAQSGIRAVLDGRLRGQHLLNATGRDVERFSDATMVQSTHGIDIVMRDDEGFGIWQSPEALGLLHHFVDSRQRLVKELALVRPRVPHLGFTAIVMERFSDATREVILHQAAQLPHPGVYGHGPTHPPRASRG